ncbi:MAG: pyridoxamine 5'-phosphate oxidase family protein [Ilumatobacteraceae bacterium]
MGRSERVDRVGVEHLTTDECWRLFAHHEVGRLAVAISDHPDIFPVNYVVDRGGIVFRTGPGTKLAASVLGRGVAFEIDGYDPLAGEAWSVVVKGSARLVEHMIEYFAADDLPLFPWHAAPKPEIVRIDVDEITGRRFRVVERAAIEAADPAHVHPYTSPD